MSRICGSSPAGSLRNGSTRLAPGCLTISSSPVDPSGKRTVSRSRLMMRPVYWRAEDTRPGSAILWVCGEFDAVGAVLEHRPELHRRDRRLDLRRVADHHHLQRVGM